MTNPWKCNNASCDSGAPAARKAAKRSPIPIKERKENPWVDFLMVIIDNNNARGRVRKTAMTKSPRMEALLQLIGWQWHAPLVCSFPFWYWTTAFYSTPWLVSSIPWPVSLDHIAGASLVLNEFMCFVKFTANQLLCFYWKTSQNSNRNSRLSWVSLGGL